MAYILLTVENWLELSKHLYLKTWELESPRRIRELVYPSDGYNTPTHTPPMRAEQALGWARREAKFQGKRENKE